MRENVSIPPKLGERVARGDRHAFRSLYDLIYPVVYRYVRYFLSVREDCEEAVSEVFFTLWKQRAKLPDIQDLTSWLFIISRNEAFRIIRQKEKDAALSIDDIPIELAVDAGAIEGKMIEKEMLQLYNEAVTGLPERCKLIFLMVREERMKYKEIAEILSISEGTIEQQMNRAIRKIVDIVRKHYPYIGSQKKE